jgi:hypothetical protein
MIKKYQCVKIKYLSEAQSSAMEQELSNLGFRRTIRSDNDVLLDSKKLSELKGGDFAKLRNKKHQIRRMNFMYVNLSITTLSDAQTVLKKWNELRLPIYKHNRVANEIALVKAIAGNYCDQTTCGFIQYYKDQPTGVVVYDTSRPFTLVSFIIKGINYEASGGSPLSTTALYLHVAEIAAEAGKPYIHDGYIGLEPGTIYHKKSLKPIPYDLKTYDYVKGGIYP